MSVFPNIHLFPQRVVGFVRRAMCLNPLLQNRLEISEFLYMYLAQDINHKGVDITVT
eukprot:TRINITY_DN13362_c0_g1_i1.p2 TRINITY_DN13362_c0_g1~~TRINITY_DN13362_c0_g1_i1.p2  ORF type:complete len:57 (+),score=3.07 TRINITY_DN13362_c0_g1_i1:203-373(+)